MQFAGIKVQVAPLQSQQLAAPQTGCQLQQEELVVAFFPRLNQEALDFLSRKHLHFSRFFGRQSAAVGWVALEQAILYSLLQRTAAAEMAVPHGTVG